MNAITQLRPYHAGSPDPALLLAAVEALPESLAIAASGLIVYANPAWRGMFECPDPDPLHGLLLEDLLPSDFLTFGPGAGLREEGETGSEGRINCK